MWWKQLLGTDYSSSQDKRAVTPISTMALSAWYLTDTTIIYMYNKTDDDFYSSQSNFYEVNKNTLNITRILLRMYIVFVEFLYYTITYNIQNFWYLFEEQYTCTCRKVRNLQML